MRTLTEESPLGKTSRYVALYQKDLLFPIPRLVKRNEIHVPHILPFTGGDIWNGFEISWLNLQGKPLVAVGKFIFPCTSPNIVESKSFKLYLNSFNNTNFAILNEVSALMTADLSAAAGAPVSVKLVECGHFVTEELQAFTGVSLDTQDVVCDTYIVQPEYLTVSKNEIVDEILVSDLLKSNCLVTGQPDWGSVKIHYQGARIDHAGLLKYIVSFRNHNEFHEQCVERIFMDIMRRCQPEVLTVEARYTRRGGLDINPYRSTDASFKPKNIRLCRQ
jgi:7-cyano-7-deazaguanine reductase